jgi:hypothetical protein
MQRNDGTPTFVQANHREDREKEAWEFLRGMAGVIEKKGTPDSLQK